MNTGILSDLKTINWQTVIDYGNSLTDLNERQFRFIKGYAIELLVEAQTTKIPGGGFSYVGNRDVHRDFIWDKYNLSIELKSQLSESMYRGYGGLRKTINIKLNNSMGSNKKQILLPSDIADVLIVIRADGSFLINRDLILSHLVCGGDGFSVKVSSDLITEISGKIERKISYVSKLKENITNVVKEDVPCI